MSATYNLVTIPGAGEFDVYSDIGTADQYLAADATANGTAWRALADDDEKARYLVTATRLLDRQIWPGTKTESDQPLEFPRDSMGSDCAEDGIIPQRLIDAASTLAAMMAAGIDVTGSASIQSEIKRQAAGSVSIEYFRPVDAIARFPLPVQELLGCLLSGGSSSVSGVESFGTCEPSDFSCGYEPNQGF